MSVCNRQSSGSENMAATRQDNVSIQEFPMKTFKTGAAIASAAAMLAFAGIASVSPAQAAGAHASKAAPCYGVNSCKGQSDCKSGTHDCKGQNDCKGQGFKDLSAKACAKAGGSLTPKAG
jgi:uncharacterized membrane protein